MSIINCPECKGPISDKAIKCPHCGYPMRSMIYKAIDDQQKVREQQLWNNPFYEYMVEVLLDNPNGTVDDDQLQETLDYYAGLGWRLHSVFSSEIGKDETSIGIRGIRSGVNSTIEQIVLIFERCVKPEE